MKNIHIYALPLRIVVEIMLAGILLWAILSVCFHVKSQKAQRIWRCLNAVLSCLSVLVILRYTVFKRTGGREEALPFIRTIEHIKAQPELIREMLMNAFLFFPLGLTMPHGLRSKRNHPVLLTILEAFMLSCVVELIQYAFHTGNAELSDIIMNTLGAAIGCVSYLPVSRVRAAK